MNRQIKIMGYAALAALFIVSWVSPRAGTYVALKAKFIYNASYEILNDVEPPAGQYAYIDSGKPQGNPWIWFDSVSGRFRMTVARGSNTALPYVKVLMVNIKPWPQYEPGSNCELYAGVPNVPDNIRWFWFTSGAEVRDTNGDGIMDTGYADLNLKDMNIDDVKYCILNCRFQTFDNQCEYDWGVSPGPAGADNVVRVEVIDDNGKKVWKITPYVGSTQDCSQRKLMRAVYTKKSGAGFGGYCDAGVWDADFELWITLK